MEYNFIFSILLVLVGVFVGVIVVFLFHYIKGVRASEKIELLLAGAKKEADKIESKQIEKEKFTVEQKIATIKDVLILKKSVKFSELMSHTTSKDEIVTTFMALLELLKLQTIKVKQNNLFEDIDIIRVEENNG